jgi:hypothetical protein
MYFVACGATGFGDLICETESGRPLGISTAELSRRDSRRVEDEECLDLRSLSDDECFDDDDEDEDVLDDDLCEDFSDGTSRMLRTRPVVGSVVEDWAGSWETWYPSMM